MSAAGRTAREKVDAALAEVTTLPPAAAAALLGAPGVLFVDLREAEERQQHGGIAGAFHAPRGVLEFWADRQCEWHRPEFSRPDTRYVLFCAAGWRSALAAQTLQQMGFEDVAHVGGGLAAWKAAGLPWAPT